MDSGNSGSLQSSSCGEEECESRSDSISAFFNHQTSHLVGSLSQHPPPPLFRHHPTHTPTPTPSPAPTSTMFDPLSNYFDPSLSRSPASSLQNQSNPLLNLDPMIWSSSKTLPSDQNHNHPFFNDHHQPFFPPSSSSSTVPFPPVTTTSQSQQQSSSSSAAAAPSTAAPPVRNPKKRSRASRRAPTTVLTTDTSNFRAMVQEFTGIPPPPFTSSSSISSSPFTRTRLDLFGTPSSIRSNPNFDNNTQPPPYLLRPLPQKLHPPTFISSASSSSASSSLLNNSNTSTTNNMQNPIFQPNFLNQGVGTTTPSFLGSKTNDQQQPSRHFSNDSHLKMGVLEEFGLKLPAMQNLISSDGTAPAAVAAATPRNNDNPVSANWGGHRAGQSYGNGKQAGEGMVESWICSSD